MRRLQLPQIADAHEKPAIAAGLTGIAIMAIQGRRY
jgi:hypothetical protein